MILSKPYHAVVVSDGRQSSSPHYYANDNQVDKPASKVIHILNLYICKMNKGAGFAVLPYDHACTMVAMHLTSKGPVSGSCIEMPCQ